MYVVGHVATIASSGVFPDVDLLEGEEVLTAMIPDLVACHDWAYERAWRWGGSSTAADLVCAHMLGDALVHHGSRWHRERRKVGWAYRRMGVISGFYDEFFDCAERRGWRVPGVPRDSRRGWAHTMVEYSVDQWFTDSRSLDGVHRATVAAARSTLADRTWIDHLVEALDVEPSKPLGTQPSRYCSALARADQPDELHLRGLAVKFGLEESDEVIAWIRSLLRRIVRAVGDDEYRAVTRQLSDVVIEAAELGYPLSEAARWAGGVEG